MSDSLITLFTLPAETGSPFLSLKKAGRSNPLLEAWAAGTKVLDPKLEPKVVYQSVPAGTRVARGTVIQLKTARPGDIKAEVLVPNLAASLKNASVVELAKVGENPLVLEVLKKFSGETGDLTADDHKVLAAGINAAVPGAGLAEEGTAGEAANLAVLLNSSLLFGK